MSTVRIDNIERVLQAEPSVDECVVVRRPTAGREAQIVAYVASAQPFSRDRLQQYLQQRLGAEFLPEAYVAVSRLPLTPDGHLDEQALLALPVLEADVIARWQEHLASLAEVDQVAVVAQPYAQAVARLHLADLLPDWKQDRKPGTTAAAEPDGPGQDAPDPSDLSSGDAPDRVALCDGGPLPVSSARPQTLCEALLRAAQRASDDDITYVQPDGSEIRQSYAELLEQSRRILAGLRKAGLRPGDKALLQLDDNRNVLAAFWGCVLGGFVPVIAALPPTYTEPHRALDHLCHVWKLLDRPLIITAEGLLESVKLLAGRLPIGPHGIATVEELRRNEPDDNHHGSTADDPLFFTLTSGSTSAPKCVLLTHRNILTRAEGTNRLCGHTARDVILSWLPFDHIGSISDWHLRAVLLGCPLVYAPKEYVIAQPLRWLELIDKHRATHTWAPNFAYALINEAAAGAQGAWDLSCVEAFLTAGESVSSGVVEKFLEVLSPCGLPPTSIRPAFGMAEMGSGVTYSCATQDTPLKVRRVRRSSLAGRLVAAGANDPDAVTFVGLGPPIAGVALRIVDADGHLVPERTVGNLHVKGEPVSAGYYQNPEANAVFRDDGWFDTGDLGFLCHGELYVTGRAKESIIVNGANYYCGEIEEIVESVEGVEPSFTAACAVPGANGEGETLAVFFHTPLAGDDDLLELLKEIRRTVVRQIGVMPEYMIPVEKEAIPKGNIGKRQRSQVGERFLAGEFDQAVKRLDLLLGSANTLPDWFYRKCWCRKDLLNRRKADKDGGATLVLLDALGLGAAVCEGLRQQGRRVVTLEAGTEYEQLGPGRYRLAPDRPEGYRRLFDSLAAAEITVDQILHFGNFDAYPGQAPGVEDFRQSQQRGVAGILHLVRAAGGVQGTERPVRLCVVSSHSQAVADDEPISVQRTPVPGLTRAIARETAWLDCRHVDCPSDSLETTAAMILDECEDASTESEVALRGRRRFVPRLEKLDLQAKPDGNLPFQPGAVYLLAGELSTAAVEIARNLLQRGVRLLALHHAASQQPESAGALAMLQQSGGELVLEAVDLDDPQQAEEAVARAEARWQCNLDGVIHCPGAVARQSLTEEGPDRVASEVTRCTARAWMLHELLGRRGRGVFVSLSSARGLLGGATEGAAAMLGSFLEGLAAYQNQAAGLTGFCCFAETGAVGNDTTGNDAVGEIQPAGGCLELTARETLLGLLAGLHRGASQLLLGLDANDPHIQRACQSAACRAEELTGYVTTRAKKPRLALPEPEIRDPFGTPSDCEITVLEEMPLDENGQIDRRCLASGAYLQRSDQAAAPHNQVQRQIAEVWQEVLGLSEVGIHDNVFELGGHSLLLVQIHSKLQSLFGPRLSVVDMFKYPTVDALAGLLGGDGPAAAGPSPSQRGRRRAELRKEMRSAGRSTDVAVIGLACRFPGSEDPGRFWQNLREGVESISRFSQQEVVEAGIDPALAADPNYVKAGPVLDNVEDFDAEFFGYTARETELMDPQHRLMLECAWEAMEDGGYNPRSREGSVGVFVGGVLNTYLLNNVYPSGAYLQNEASEVMTLNSAAGFQVMVAGDKDYLPTRISYKLDLTGPSVNVQTACSTSLVAIHMAAQSVLAGDCDMALAGGVSVSVPQKTGYLYEEGLLVSPDGHCRAFDARAQGTIFGNGAGVVLLKRLEDALADGDRIYAVIKGSAVNNDGGTKVGFFAPSQDGQGAVVAEALAVAGVEADSISYVEMHGTGTALGDPIEIAGLAQAFRADTERKQFCAVGSVKTNIGHLQIASGVAGFIKATLALHHGELPPSLHFEHPNPQIDFAGSPFFVNAQLADWPQGELPRRAGVNSLGIGGTNAHVILEEAPERPPAVNPRECPRHVLTLSAKTAPALRSLARRYAEMPAAGADVSPADLCFTANTGRGHFQHRLAVAAESRQEFCRSLEDFAAGRAPENLHVARAPDSSRPQVAFLFTGQGSQYFGMGRQLYDTQPAFRRCIEECDEILRPQLAESLLSVLYEDPAKESLLNETAYAQPALFAVEYALARLWTSWGITPAAVMGHSVGQYVAACTAGVFSLEDALKLIAQRGRLMQDAPGRGQMFAVMAGEDLAVSHAFHSPLMEPIVEEFRRIASGIEYAPPQIPIISDVSGKPCSDEIASADYWCRHLREPVRFARGMAALVEQGCDRFLELGPQPTLLALARQCLANSELCENEDAWLPSLRRGRGDWEQILDSLARLYVHGAPVDWPGVDQDYQRRRTALPTYPFQRKRYWIERPAGAERHARARRSGKEQLHPLLGTQVRSPALKDVVFESALSLESLPLVEDHRFCDVPILPGACYLAMVADAAGRAWGRSTCMLEDVVFARALVLEQRRPRSVQLILSGRSGQVGSFQVVSRDAEAPGGDDSWTVHATGRIVPFERPRSTPAQVLPEVREKFIQSCRGRCSRTDFYETMRQHEVELGPRFRIIETVWLDEGEIVCRLEIPDRLDGFELYQLHPVILDACLQVPGGVRTYDRDATLVPGGVERVRFIERPQTGRMWCHVRIREGHNGEDSHLTTDACLFDEDGRVIATLEGLRYKQVPRRDLLRVLGKDFAEGMFRPAWVAEPLAPAEEQPQQQVDCGRWLILTDRGGLGDRLAELLQQRGEECVLVEAGDEFRSVNAGQYQVDPAEPEHFRRLLEATQGFTAQPYRGIVHLWSLDASLDAEDSAGGFDRSQIPGCAGALHLLQAVDQVAWTEAPLLCLVTGGAQPLEAASAVLCPEQSALWGLGRTIALERPDLQCLRVDLDPAGGSDRAEALAAELFAPRGNQEIGFRGQDRYVARLVRDEADASKQPVPLGEGTYLITGGTGGVGIEVARCLVDRGVRHLALVSRSGASSAEARQAIETWQRAGVEVAVLEADVSRRADVAGVFERIRADMPPLRGVFHLAGVLDDAILQRQSWDRFRNVMAAKAEGAWNLHCLTRELPLDFFVAFSSIASLLGSPGQANYAAANAFVDALIHHRRALNLPGLSINWGPWAEAGMAAGLNASHREDLARRGLESLDTSLALHALCAALEQDAPQVAVLSVDWPAYLRETAGGGNPAFFQSVAKTAETSTEPQGDFLRRLDQAPAGERRPMLFDLVRRLVGQLLGLDGASPIGSEQGFFQLGMDSLASVQLRNRLQNAVGVSLPATLAFKYGTVQALSDYLADEVLALETPATAPAAKEATPQPTDPRAELSAALEELSEDELAGRLAEKLASMKSGNGRT